jgi:hypothetical protein
MKMNIVTAGRVSARFVAAVRELCASVEYANCPIDVRIAELDSSILVEFAGDRVEFRPGMASYVTSAERLGTAAKHVAEGWRRGKMLDAASCTEPVFWLVHSSRFFREWLDQTELGINALVWNFAEPRFPSYSTISRGCIYAEMKGAGMLGRVNYNQLTTEVTLSPIVKYCDNRGHRFIFQDQIMPDTVICALGGTRLADVIDSLPIRGSNFRIESARVEGDSSVVTIEPDRASLLDIPARALSVMPADADSWAPWRLRPQELNRLMASTAALAALAR